MVFIIVLVIVSCWILFYSLIKGVYNKKMRNYLFIVTNPFNLKSEATQHELNSIKDERRDIISLFVSKMKE